MSRVQETAKQRPLLLGSAGTLEGRERVCRAGVCTAHSRGFLVSGEESFPSSFVHCSSAHS